MQGRPISESSSPSSASPASGLKLDQADAASDIEAVVTSDVTSSGSEATSRLLLRRVGVGARGNYTCVAENLIGKGLSGRVELFVKCEDSIHVAYN